MTILPVYAALLALLFVLLSIRTIRTRHSRKVALGHGDDPAMLRAMRVHANFAEYVPLALLLIYFVEATSQTPWLVHLLGSALLLGRVCHAFGMSHTPENFRYRVAGMGLTFAVILVSAAHILITAQLP
ncbi:glutathione metabolism protein [Aeromonas allosaccharophila]|uniref:MAPEG family protein n=1 Tax=Aeromonas allosaccharophila TaxID=656 RepID=UPI0005B2006F|nr:MAPEG family protein [Aeromonas allosaccharophila]OKP44827.1 glutathione metabolism protein [Aeromonas allosaccharophila]